MRHSFNILACWSKSPSLFKITPDGMRTRIFIDFRFNFSLNTPWNSRLPRPTAKEFVRSFYNTIGMYQFYALRVILINIQAKKWSLKRFFKDLACRSPQGSYWRRNYRSLYFLPLNVRQLWPKERNDGRKNQPRSWVLDKKTQTNKNKWENSRQVTNNFEYK